MIVVSHSSWRYRLSFVAVISLRLSSLLVIIVQATISR
ncbi:hypothetical protein WN943_006297 [Citrus x changshan-huyou]